MSNQKRTVKPLKYMLADKMAPGNREYLALESPPSHMPVKRYSDISGLEAKVNTIYRSNYEASLFNT
ncbi:hypothetical protein QYM36_013369 [Artemia franciscana]|uniref:Uncharacterized protein n=1 Tax=Artemia franciscana TaxID=6661 RepID=A0AA88HPX6_ARTSF|nr:hypothetical protein QYM36_013369 [Artemia franciscana]